MTAALAASATLPPVAGALFVGLMLVGGCFLCAAVVVAGQGRGGGEKKEGEK